MFREVGLSEEGVQILQRIDSLESLAMTDLPRVAALEAWKRDAVREFHDLQDWRKARKLN